MELSTFELLVKPIAPRVNPALEAVARRAVQGYFLTLTNLDSKDITFRLTFVISQPNPADPDRTLFNNADLIYDIAGANMSAPLSGGALSTSFSGFVRIPAKQTASVQLLPRLTPELLALAEPDLEVRGYVNLTVPALFKSISQGFVPQSDAPVPVLLNPETRGTFLPNGYPADLSGDFDQINYGMAIASGKALNQLMPDPGRPILIPPVLSNVLERLQTSAPFPVISEDDVAQLTEELVLRMAQLDRSPENLQSFSDLLSKLDIPLRVSRV
jgi:hypothetical protein